MLRLKYKLGDGTEAAADIDELPANLGRHPRSSVVVDHPGVSREHARLFEREGAILIADLNSSNGTFLNGEKVSRAALKAGDEIRLGKAVLSVEKCEPKGSALPAPSGADAHPDTEPVPVQEKDPPSEPDIFDIDGADIFDDDAPPAAEPTRVEPWALPPAAARRPKPAPPPPTVRRGAGGVQVRDGLLQYHKISADRKAGLLRSEFVQHHPFFRVAAIIVMLALAAGIFFLFKWLTEKTVPAPGIENQDSIEIEMDEQF